MDRQLNEENNIWKSEKFNREIETIKKKKPQKFYSSKIQ